jgi:23S rRNA (pseudouridine1915-N3)-methyltransferase
VIYCVFIGPFKEKRLQQMAEQYHQRLERLWPVTLTEIPGKPKDIERFIEAKKEKGILVSLDAQGQVMNSEAFSRWVTQASRDLFFFAWGADGPPGKTEKTGMKSVSLSPMTYSHELARVLLMEQLYRAGATLRGHPYPR